MLFHGTAHVTKQLRINPRSPRNGRGTALLSESMNKQGDKQQICRSDWNYVGIILVGDVLEINCCVLCTESVDDVTFQYFSGGDISLVLPYIRVSHDPGQPAESSKWVILSEGQRDICKCMKNTTLSAMEQGERVNASFQMGIDQGTPGILPIMQFLVKVPKRAFESGLPGSDFSFWVWAPSLHSEVILF